MSAPQEPRRFAWARLGLFALLPAASVAGGLALAPILALAGIASLQRVNVRPLLPLLIPLALLIVWAALSALWSPFGSAVQIAKFAATTALGLAFAYAAMQPQAQRLTQAAAAAALIVLALFLATEALGDMPLNRAVNPDALTWQIAGNPGRGAVVLIALIWGTLGWLITRRAWLAAGAAALIAAWLSTQFGQSANSVAFALGAAAFALGYLAPRLAILATSGALSAWMLLAPFLTPLLIGGLNTAALPFSWASRVEIWRYTSARILEAPLVGHGLDAARTTTDTLLVHGQAVRAMPLHPHSASLQIWFETGAIGAVLAAACLLIGGWRLAQRWRDHRVGAAAACATLAALGLIANASFGVWQEWWNAVWFVAAAGVGALGRSGEPEGQIAPR